jgi:hypothetical protein
LITQTHFLRVYTVPTLWCFCFTVFIFIETANHSCANNCSYLTDTILCFFGFVSIIKFFYGHVNLYWRSSILQDNDINLNTGNIIMHYIFFINYLARRHITTWCKISFIHWNDSTTFFSCLYRSQKHGKENGGQIWRKGTKEYRVKNFII